MMQIMIIKKGNGSPYSITDAGFRSWCRFFGSQPAGDMSHKPGGRLSLLSAKPAVTPTTLKRAATNFAAWWKEAQWLWTVCLRLLPESVTLRFEPSHMNLTRPLVVFQTWVWLVVRIWTCQLQNRFPTTTLIRLVPIPLRCLISPQQQAQNTVLEISHVLVIHDIHLLLIVRRQACRHKSFFLLTSK